EIEEGAAGAAPNAEAAPAAEVAPEKKADMPLSPAARKLAADTGVDVSTISGTGKDGRVTKGDILAATANAEVKAAPAPAVVETPKPAQEKPAAPAQPAPSQPAKASSPEGRVTRTKMSPLRRKIAERLVSAQQTAAILTTFNEVDMGP